MRATVTALGIACVAYGLAGAAARTAGAAGIYASVDGGFKVAFPGRVAESVSVEQAGPVALRVHSLVDKEGGGHVLLVMWNDYPPLPAEMNREAFYDHLQEGYVVSGQNVLASRAVKLGDRVGRELEVDTGKGVYHRVRFYLVGNRLYQIMGNVPLAARDEAGAADFLDSFVLWSARDFPARGFRLEGATLPGWQASDGSRGKVVIEWIGPTSTPAAVRSFVSIESGPPTANGATAALAAAELAKSWGGQVGADKITLDGEAAVKIDAPPRAGELRPVEALVALHGGSIYLVIGAVNGDEKCSEQLEEVRKAWKWEPAVAASMHLEFLPDPVSALGGAVVVNYPRDMHRNETAEPERVLDLSLFDMRTGKEPLQAYIQMAPIQAGMTFDALAQTFLEKMNGKKITEQPFAWRPAKGGPGRMETDALRSEMISKDLKRDVYVKCPLN